MTAGETNHPATAPGCADHGGAKDRLLAVFSAELRTALHCVLGNIELLQTTRLDGEQQELAGSLHRSTSVLLSTVDDALDLATMELGQVQVEIGPFMLHELLRGCIDLQAHMARAKRLDVQLDIATDVAASALGDAMRLRQVCMSLLAFAIKSTPSGGVHLIVRNRGDGLTEFCIVDTSPGLGPAALARLFDRQDSSTEKSRRFGIPGLTLGVCRELVALMGGELQVRSVVGQGTSFTFAIPLAGASLADGHHPSSPLPPKQGCDCRVLVVDDTAGNRLVVKRMLQRLGCLVVTAENGAEAIQRAREQPFDIVLMDCLMPVLDGCEATRVIRAQGGLLASLPIVAMTANLEQHDQARCEAVGMSDCLEKPIRLRDLETLLSRLLPGHVRTSVR